MKKILPILVLILGIVSIGLIDQYNPSDDDPNVDNIPQEMLDRMQNNPQEPSRVEIDSDGFEDFFLGVDFAEPHISMNPRNPMESFGAYNTNAVYGTTNGYSWFRNTPNFGQTMRGDPITAYDSTGRLYYDNMYGSPNILGTRTITSTNGSVSWLPPVFANVGRDKNWIAADQSAGPYSNNVYGVMTPGNVVRSTNQGASFSTVASFSNNLPGMMNAVGANVIGGNVSGGCAYVVTNTGSSTNPFYTFYRSTNGGTSFATMSSQQFVRFVGTFVNGRHSVEGMRTRPYPFITADNSYGPNRGRLYLIYAKNTPDQSGAKPDIMSRYSDNHGATWSAEKVVNDDPSTTNNTQFMPATWCDKETGRLYVKWMDTRDTPTSDSAYIYATYSDDGGVTFAANQRISTKKMKINCSTCGGGGNPRYQGDYDAITSNSVTSLSMWTDFRNGTFGSYVAYFPDYAMKVSPSEANIGNNSSTNFTVEVPAVKLYDKSVKFTATLDQTPTSGTITLSFQGGIDSLTSYPGSVTLVASTSSNVTPGRYNVSIVGRGPNGTPVHKRTVSLFVNASRVVVGTNRGSPITFKVNGNSYNASQEFVFANGTNVTVEAPGSVQSGSNRFVFENWSDGGDTTHSFSVTSNLNLTATYKVQYRFLMVSSQGNIFGGNTFYDSAGSFTFGVTSRTAISGSDTFYYRGFNGGGPGSYTSPDSSGLDSAINWSITNPVVESARWSLDPPPVSISPISSEIPGKYELYQNYPNPFNPETNIKFDLIKSGNVKVVVYDLLGKEVQTLLNDFQQPGRYEVRFNGSALASGIYYYKIITPEFVQVRKMLLIK